MSDTNPLQSLNMATQKVTNEIMFLRECKNKLEFDLSEERKKTKNLEEALYCETLSKMSERKNADGTLFAMILWWVVLLAVVVYLTLGY